jgi:TonB family protein
MTHQMILSAPLSGYGACELKQKLHKNIMTGLTLATIIYAVLLGSYWSSVYLTGTDDRQFIHIRPITDYIFIPQQRIGPLDAQQIALSIAGYSGNSKFGTPVAVPDIEVIVEEPFAPPSEPIPPGQAGKGTDQVIYLSPGTEEPPPPFVPIEKQPIIVKRVNPKYPEMARRTGIEGRVWANVWIDKEGKIHRIDIIRSDSEFFNQPVIDAINQWIFTPALMNKGPVPVWVSLKFDFKLNQ